MTALEWLAGKLFEEYGYSIPHDLLEKGILKEKQQMELCAMHFCHYAIDAVMGRKEIGSKDEFEKYYVRMFNSDII